MVMIMYYLRIKLKNFKQKFKFKVWKVDFYSFLEHTLIGKKLKTIPSDINNYLEDRFDKSLFVDFILD